MSRVRSTSILVCGALATLWPQIAWSSSTFCFGKLVGPACEEVVEPPEGRSPGSVVTFAQYCNGCSTGGPDGGGGSCTRWETLSTDQLRVTVDGAFITDAKFEATATDCGAVGRLFRYLGPILPGKTHVISYLFASSPSQAITFQGAAATMDASPSDGARAADVTDGNQSGCGCAVGRPRSAAHLSSAPLLALVGLWLARRLRRRRNRV